MTTSSTKARTPPSVKLSFLPLRPSTLSVLTRKGFHSSIDVTSCKTSGGIANFAAELDVDLMEAVGIYREVESAITTYYRRMDNHGTHDVQSDNTSNSTQQTADRYRPQTAASILSAQYSQPGLKSRPIISFAQSIDSLLGGGIQPKEVTEIVGAPGVGKTQFAMQLCVDTSLPRSFGGVEGESIYIDTEGSFSPERCWDMATALYDHLQGSVRRSNGTKHLPNEFSVENILDSIHVFRVFDETSQNATIHSIPEFIQKLKESGRFVKLLVIDSIAFHYRCSSSDYKSRTKSLARVASCLSDIAANFDMAVVVINQMTTKLGGFETTDSGESSKNQMDHNARLVPALGESWAHSVTTRLLLLPLDWREDVSLRSYAESNHPQRRICKLVKSPHKPEGSAIFTITEFGIRGDVLIR